MTENLHQSVLLTEAIDGLALGADDTVVDATVGGAGHFKAFLERLGEDGTLIGIDADADAIRRARAVTPTHGPTVHLVEGNFRDLATHLDDLGIQPIDKILFDLGWSSYHLTSGRGFSFRVDEPLLMTYGEPEEGKTAADLVNTATETELADVLYTYGEERFARGIARAIVRARQQERILTTSQLVTAILAGTPAWYQHRKVHAATKTFQALRIAVNDELDALREGLTAALTRLKDGGRVAVISFHSIEDRIVKGMFRDAAYAGKGCLVTRKPIVPSDRELMHNPRARSAKLRIFERGATIIHSHIANPLHIYA